MNDYKIRIEQSNNALIRIILSVAMFFMLLFSCSRLSWGIFLPSVAWGVLLVAASGLFLLTMIVTVRRKGSIYVPILLIMLLIMVFNRNYDIKKGNFLSLVFPYVCMFFMYAACIKSCGWIGTFKKILLFFGVFYAVFTLACDMSNSLYYSIVLPIMSRYGTSYTPHPSAGFTAHYSTNGIYLALGFCVATIDAFFCPRDSRRKKWNTCMFFLLTVAQLICGKRGIFLCLIISLFVCYWCYTSGNKRGRTFKIICIALAACIILYFMSYFVPSISYMFERFTQESKKGDISNGRFALWVYAWMLFMNKPLTGYGWRWFMHNNPIMLNADAHNCFLQLLVENGILGAIPFYVFFAGEFLLVMKLAQKVRKKTSTASSKEISDIYFSLMMQAFMLPFMFEGTALYMPECMIPYFASCAIAEYYRRRI